MRKAKAKTKPRIEQKGPSLKPKADRLKTNYSQVLAPEVMFDGGGWIVDAFC